MHTPRNRMTGPLNSLLRTVSGRFTNCCAIIGMLACGNAAAEDFDLRDLDVAAWDCLDKPAGTAKTEDAIERYRAKNRSGINVSVMTPDSLDTAAFLKKVAGYEEQIVGKRRSELTSEQKEKLKAFENEVVSLTGWLVSAYAGAAETTNCGSLTFHDWHLEISEHPSGHAPQLGDRTPIICEITPRTERGLYRENVRLQSLTGFFRLENGSYQPTGHPARRVRLTGFLLWDDSHNEKADAGLTIESVDSKTNYHHPWRSTSWEIHPVMKVELIEESDGSAAIMQSLSTTAASRAISSSSCDTIRIK